MKKNVFDLIKKNFVIIIVLVALGAFLYFEHFLPFTVISSSSLNFDTTQNKWITTAIVVNGTDTLQFSKQTLFDNSFSDSTILSAQAQNGFTLKTSPLIPYCSYNLAWSTISPTTFIGIPLQSIPYATLGARVRSVPFVVSIIKDSGEKESKNIDASILGTAKTTFFNGDVEIQNLGQLSNGIDCSDSSAAYIIPIYNSDGKTISRWQLVSASDFDAYQRAVHLDLLSCGFIACLPQFLNNITQPPVHAAYSFSSQFTSVSIDNISQGSTKLIGYLPMGSSYALATISVNSQFVNTLIIKKPNGKPAITLSWNTTSFEQSKNAILTVNVKNIGTSADNFRINLNTSSGAISFNPVAQETGNLEPNSSANKTFSVYGLGAGTPTVTVTVQAIGSGQSVQASQQLNISSTPSLPPIVPQPIEVCGNGKCVSAAGETQQTCPQDCGIVPPPFTHKACQNGACTVVNGVGLDECSSDTVCSGKIECDSRPTDVLTTAWKFTPHGNPIEFFPEKCEPIYNTGIILIVIILIGSGFMYLLFFRNEKKGRGRR